MKTILLSAVLAFLFFSPALSFSAVRGAPEGKPSIGVGDAAPLEHDELQKAHRDGKAIIIMFGNPYHCRHCEWTYVNIQGLLPKYENDVAFVVIIYRPAEFWKPEDKDRTLAEKYGVIGEPWLFFIDKNGIVRKIIMGFGEVKDIEDGIKDIIKQK